MAPQLGQGHFGKKLFCVLSSCTPLLKTEKRRQRLLRQSLNSTKFNVYTFFLEKVTCARSLIVLQPISS